MIHTETEMIVMGEGHKEDHLPFFFLLRGERGQSLPPPQAMNTQQIKQ